ncbi:MAG: aminopeptidase P family protein [Cyanobacteria bacterium P01_A01_bin.105]
MTQTLAPPPTLAATLRQRRQKLAQLVNFPVVLWSGEPRPRNFAANIYPFRANSHFLYFSGLTLPQAVIHLFQGRLTLFVDEATPAEALWHGPTPTRADLAEKVGADEALPLDRLPDYVAGAASLPVLDIRAARSQRRHLDRRVTCGKGSADRQLAKAIIQLRLVQDEGAIASIRSAAAVSVEAHQTGMAVTPTAATEAQVRAAMESVIMANGMTCAYNSIVTTHGEVLHNDHYHNVLRPNDLILADVGAETASGWASDITRTWPASGQFSTTQRDLYDVVLAAHDACIAAAKPGVEYRHLHLLASRILAEGLVGLGILNGDPEGLVEQDAHALFFPHGVGHLLGLDVHDMEDLGDLAGYDRGRRRSDRFGLCFLRLDRPLRAGMVVTIEPGFYQVPGLLTDRQRRDQYRDAVNWSYLAHFADVRGIRIEDDVLITDSGAEVLTSALTTRPEEIETLVLGGF